MGNFGSTHEGASWCLKALHPSDPVVECSGIPDKCSAPTFLFNYQSQYTLSPAAGASTWSFDAALLPNPFHFMAVEKYSDVTPLGEEINFTNTQIDAATWNQSSDWLFAQTSAHRLAYMSVTCYQDGPDMANQGTIVAAQVPLHPKIRVKPCTDVTGAALQPCPYYWVDYNTLDKPTFDGTQSMPNAYFNRSKEGCYLPLKLEKDAFRWRTIEDAVVSATMVNVNSTLVQVPTVDTYPWPHQNTPTNIHGYYSCHALKYAAGAWDANTAKTPGMLNSTMGRICAKNLDGATSFTFYVRCGIEMQVRPTSSLAPSLKISPKYDPEALRAYFGIARELKDAYPADFNDLGKLWDTISSAAKFALPFVAKMGPYGAAAATLGTGAVKLGDHFRNRGRDQPPAAQIQRAREEVKQQSQRMIVTGPAIRVSRRPGKPRSSASQKTRFRVAKRGTQLKF